jgi:predicted secreted protein
MKTIEKQESKSEPLEGVEGIAVCGANFTTAVTDKSQYIREIHYRMGDRLYIENAD